MPVRMGINGFGRIGRLVFRAALGKDIEIVGINDLTDAKTLAHLLKYDSIHGRFPGEVEPGDSSLVVNGKSIPVSAERDPAKLPWKRLGATIAIESTGLFTAREKAALHLEAGAERVIISAPATDPDLTVVLGVNEGEYDPSRHKVVSNASCTTNCLAPVAWVLHNKLGIKRGLMTTIHSYTNDQSILDLPHQDLRRARAASLSMIPTTTGAARAVSLVLPELKGKLDGMAIRVPTPNVSLVDLVVEVEKDTTVEEVNQLFREESAGRLKGVLRVEEEPLVSIDFNGDAASSIVDGLSTKVMENRMVKVLSWYDNEWGYSSRVKDLIKFIVAQGI